MLLASCKFVTVGSNGCHIIAFFYPDVTNPLITQKDTVEQILEVAMVAENYIFFTAATATNNVLSSVSRQIYIRIYATCTPVVHLPVCVFYFSLVTILKRNQSLNQVSVMSTGKSPRAFRKPLYSIKSRQTKSMGPPAVTVCHCQPKSYQRMIHP